MANIYIQIGAGAGDQDAGAGFRDGFTEYVKKYSAPHHKDRIILVEPNPNNLPNLKKCWQDYPSAEIHQYGIATKAKAGQKLTLFFAEPDAPHFQTASFNAAHVLKHFPKLSVEQLLHLDVPTIDLAGLLATLVGNAPIHLLSLDIEGIDAEVLLDTDLAALNVKLISFEHLHLGKQKKAVVDHVTKAGYHYHGPGLDHHGYDWLYRKVDMA